MCVFVGEAMRMVVLVAEDDWLTRSALAEVLREEGFVVLQASDGEQAWETYRSLRPDFVCLDVMLPRLNGYEVCRKIRATSPLTPIIFITAKGEEVDRVVGLEIGGDDYIVKPFGVKEVVARIRAVARRCLGSRTQEVETSHTTEPFKMHDLEVMPLQLRARRGESWIDLSLREIRILSLLHQRAGQVIDRQSLMNYAWGQEYLPSSRTLDQHISQLRKRIETDAKSPNIIQTVHGVGYRFDP